MKANNLKLIAKNKDDLNVLSAHLQDSIISVSEIAHLKKSKLLLMQMNRFMWEDVEKGIFRNNKRIRTILKFENVLSVTSKNIDYNKKDQFLDFLAIESREMTDKTQEMNLFFSGDSVIKVSAEVIEVTLDDQGKPWDTEVKPRHKNL